MEDAENLLWPLERQARQIEDAIADAHLVWRDTNARAAEARYLQPRAAHQTDVVQHLTSQSAAVRQSDQQLELAQAQAVIAADDSALVRRLGREAEQEMAMVRDRASAAATATDRTIALTHDIHTSIAAANAAGA